MHQQFFNTLCFRFLHSKNISLSYNPSNLPQKFSQGFCGKDWEGFHFVCTEQEQVVAGLAPASPEHDCHSHPLLRCI